MKKSILTTIMVACSFLTFAQPTKIKNFEINTGIATGVVPFFPGLSALYGATLYYPSGLIVDYQGGFAFPTLITGKIGAGFNIEKQELTFGIRPFPSTCYAQIRIDRPNKESDITVSLESGIYRSSFFGQNTIVTVGWRWNNKKYLDIRKKKAE